MSQKRGFDVQFPVLLTLEEACNGASRECYYPMREGICDECSGSGEIRSVSCLNCGGHGRCYVPRRVSLNIPAGISDQARIKINGLGYLSKNHDCFGDLYLVCHFGQHHLFKRDGTDIHIEVDEAPNQQGKISVPTLEGNARIDVPFNLGLASVRIPSLGLPIGMGACGRGDLVVWFGRNGKTVRKSEFAKAKKEAKESLERKDFDGVFNILANPDLHDWLDSDSETMLGVALFNKGEVILAKEHFLEAARKGKATWQQLTNIGNVAYHQGNFLEAAGLFEIALRKGKNETAAVRDTLTSSLGQLYALQDDEDTAEAMEARRLALHRMYRTAATKFANCTGASVRMAYLEATSKLLSACMDCETVLAQAVEQFEVIQAIDPVWVQPKLAVEAAWTLAEFGLGAKGLAEFAAYQLKRGCNESARKLLAMAVLCSQSQNGTHIGRSNSNYNISDQGFSYMCGLIDKVKGCIPTNSDSVDIIKGVCELILCSECVALGEPVSTAWSHAVSAVQQLESALCQAPYDALISEHFQQALGLFNGLSNAIVKENDPDFLHFWQNTCDAASQKLIPHAPVNDSSFQRDDNLRFICQSAYNALFNHSRSPLAGECLVAAVDGFYVLTNYRLLITNDRLPVAQLLPLNVIKRYGLRAEGINVVSVLIDLAEGRQVILNNTPRGACPDERLVNYLIAARMWERLGSNDQSILEKGSDQAVSSIKRETAGNAVCPLDRGSSETHLPSHLSQDCWCRNCGMAIRLGDLFCRNCGCKVKEEDLPGPQNMLNGGND